MATSDGFFDSGTFTITDSVGGVWQLFKRYNNMSGGVEVWYRLVGSIQSSMTVTATFSNGTTNALALQVVTLSGHNTLNPFGSFLITDFNNAAVNAALATSYNDSYVFGVFSKDADNTTTVVGSGQTKIGQSTPSVSKGDGTFWRRTSLTPAPKTSETMNITTPATAVGDLILFEILESKNKPNNYFRTLRVESGLSRAEEAL